MNGFSRVFLCLALTCAPQFAVAQSVSPGTGAVLRWLDKVSGQTEDITLKNGQTWERGRLSVRLAECRYPDGDVAGNAYAEVTITDAVQTSGPVFQGWMVADSPALNPLDHPRYDVWVLRCTTD